jgi:aspartate aminotransferase-like enzyme
MMPGLVPDLDPDGLLEYSVVFTDRSLNHMSKAFQSVMRDISATLRHVYSAKAVAVVPGGGTYAMEAVARQFATGRRCLVIRNGWFSYRWSQIFEAGDIPSQSIVLKARPVEPTPPSAFAPPAIEEVVATIRAEKPDVVFAPHVETSSGMILPDEYLQAIGAAVRSVGGLFVLDCVASGTIWVDMKSCDVDVLISAPQKGWSGSPCAGLVMLSELALERLPQTSSTSFACDLAKWLEIMRAYERGGHAYHATMPTDGLRAFRDVMLQTLDRGIDRVRAQQEELGRRVREALVARGFASVAADGFQAPGVVVSYTDDDDIRTGRSFAARGIQIAAGVPLRCDEPEDFKTFRVGLFGLDKLDDVNAAVARFEAVLDQLAEGSVALPS